MQLLILTGFHTHPWMEQVSACTSCAQVHELPQIHCGDNHIVFMIKPHCFPRGNVGQFYLERTEENGC